MTKISFGSLLVVLACTGVFMFAGCEKDDGNPVSGGSSSPLSGTWSLTSVNFGGMIIPAGSTTLTQQLVFTGNTVTATTTENGTSETETGTWSASGDQLTFTPNDGSAAETMTYSVSGSTLTTTIVEDHNGTPITVIMTYAKQ